MQPKEVTDAEVVFGGRMEELMPPFETIPKKFQCCQTKWNQIVSRWFFEGLPNSTEFTPQKGIDVEKAVRHLRAILRSFEPKHEHKEAGCAYLMSLWFDKIDIPKK